MDRKQGILYALEHMGSEDAVVIIGKGREEYQEINGEKIYHSDFKVVEKFIS